MYNLTHTEKVNQLVCPDENLNLYADLVWHHLLLTQDGARVDFMLSFYEGSTFTYISFKNTNNNQIFYLMIFSR